MIDANTIFSLCEIQASEESTPIEKTFAKALVEILNNINSMETNLMLK